MRRAALALAALLLALAGCADEPKRADDPAPTDGSPSPTASPSPTTGPVDPDDPVRNLLDWQPLEVGEDRVVRTEDRTLTISSDGRRVTVTGGSAITVDAPGGYLVEDAWLEDQQAVLVLKDQAEERPLRLLVQPFDGSRPETVDRPTPATGGATAYADGRIAYATAGSGGTFCLATYDTSARSGERSWCAEPRHGWSNVTISPAGLALMTFDDTRPVSCRTLVAVADGDATPVEGVPDCRGWDVLLTDDGAVWSTVPDEKRIERGTFFASADGEVTELGVGTTGTLTWCGDSAYFVRDAQKDRGDRARLLRWTPDHTLEVVYESPGEGEAFLDAPACADGVLTVTAYDEGGDERVWATVPG